MANDIRRAFFYAKTNRDVYVDLPPEDAREGMCAKLVLSLYGTRDAPQTWQKCYTKSMRQLGFKTTATSPCIFYHQVRDIITAVHGDDFMSTGTEEQLLWLRTCLESNTKPKLRS